MSEFASCYFCGTALDAQIEAYPVVPETAATEDRPTVDLCPVCRRKLSKVLDVALSAADDAAVSATPLAAGPEPSPLEADHEDPTADIGTKGETGEQSEPAYAVEPSGEATAVDEERDATDDADDSDPGTAGVDHESTAAEPASEADRPPETADAEDTVDGDEASASEGDPDEDADVTANGSADAERGADGADQPSVLSTPAAKKIIKLLQNREFPVAREEIAVVATNAYAIPEEDCADVLDALVAEDYVAERTGNLVRPEE